MKEITKEEFCRLTGTAEDSYLFNYPEESIRFFRDEKDGIFYYINRNGSMMRFRRMAEYGEIWSSEASWSIWGVWELMDDEEE